MQPDREDRLRADHPMFYGSLPYFECGDGWYDVLDALGAQVEEYQKARRLKVPVHAIQVKEKFGGLRVYTSPSDELVAEAVQKAEKEASTICEACGKPGLLRRSRGWLSTLCDDHARPAE